MQLRTPKYHTPVKTGMTQKRKQGNQSRAKEFFQKYIRDDEERSDEHGGQRGRNLLPRPNRLMTVVKKISQEGNESSEKEWNRRGAQERSRGRRETTHKIYFWNWLCSKLEYIPPTKTVTTDSLIHKFI